MTLPDNELLDAPGAVFTDPEDISNDARVVGLWTDPATPDGVGRGFMAPPVPNGQRYPLGFCATA